jgi:benzoyl-CoA reductase/2-hydroxyglutaryl-CoA dehydratase subunit BcrC/BadD/HgdB
MGIDPIIPMLDLIIAQCDDCHMSRLADMFEYLKLPTVRIGIPPDWDKSISAEYYLNGLKRLKKTFEEFTGNEISDQALKSSIETLNRIKGLLSRIGELRKQPSPPIGGYDIIRLNHASFYWQPNEFEQKLSELYGCLRKNRNRFSETAPRILFMGHVVAMGDYVVPKLIEDVGGVIVTEFLDEGIRHCQRDIKTDGNLMQNLADTYFKERIPPCIFQPSWQDRIRHLEELIKDYQVQGLIWYQLSFDEIYDMEYPVISQAAEKWNIPVLRLESSYEYAREAMGPLTTRVESFVEALEEGRRNNNG